MEKAKFKQPISKAELEDFKQRHFNSQCSLKLSELKRTPSEKLEILEKKRMKKEALELIFDELSFHTCYENSIKEVLLHIIEGSILACTSIIGDDIQKHQMHEEIYDLMWLHGLIKMC